MIRIGKIIEKIFLAKGPFSPFPKIGKEERILILAPHIDDEVISAGGLILRALASKAKIKIIYLTNGDSSFGAVISQRRWPFSPSSYLKVGIERMAEGRRAVGVLGLSQDDLLFLGYPDKGLLPMLEKFYFQPFTSPKTKVNFNPYSGTFKEKRVYKGENLVLDLKEIIQDFKPTMIFSPHQKDLHPDHQATFQFLRKVIEEKPLTVFSYLVHFRFYPPRKKFLPQEFLYPPKKLISKKTCWLSLELTGKEEERKIKALREFKTQIKQDPLILALARRNEIFEV